MNHLIETLRELSPIEWGGALTGFICVYLTVKNRIANWFWGILSVLLYAWVFWVGKLYANAFLQILYFLPCCIYGWWVWAKAGPKQDDDLPVTDLTNRARIGWLIAAVVFSLCIGLPIALHTNDPFPYTDSFTTGFSIVAQYLQAKKVFENWGMWIAVDVVYAFYFFPSQSPPLWISSVLYALFTVLAIRGAIEWKPLIGKAVVR